MSIAVVTGSASGIGAAVRRRLEKAGDRVVGIDLRDAEIEADLSTSEGRDAAIDAARQAAGNGIDRLVLCAGLGAHVEDPAAIASVNFFGAVRLLDGLHASMAGRPGRAAVVVASNSIHLVPLGDHPYVRALLDDDEPGAREQAREAGGFIAYAGSKHALALCVRQRATRWGESGVRLNAVAPGTTQTPLLQGAADHPVFGKGLDALPIPLGRRAEPDEIAGAIAFLLGPEAGYVHGSIFFVDGGGDAATRPDAF